MVETTRCYAVVRRADMSVVYVTNRTSDIARDGSTIIAWTPDLGPAPWDVYAYDVASGLHGLIGGTSKPQFLDAGIEPDTGRSPAAAFWDKHFPNVPPVARD